MALCEDAAAVPRDDLFDYREADAIAFEFTAPV
jgi:hypothetical protein